MKVISVRKAECCPIEFATNVEMRQDNVNELKRRREEETAALSRRDPVIPPNPSPCTLHLQQGQAVTKSKTVWEREGHLVDQARTWPFALPQLSLPSFFLSRVSDVFGYFAVHGQRDEKL
jgi:hypothetical protein